MNYLWRERERKPMQMNDGGNTSETKHLIITNRDTQRSDETTSIPVKVGNSDIWRISSLLLFGDSIWIIAWLLKEKYINLHCHERLFLFFVFWTEKRGIYLWIECREEPYRSAIRGDAFLKTKASIESVQSVRFLAKSCWCPRHVLIIIIDILCALFCQSRSAWLGTRWIGSLSA